MDGLKLSPVLLVAAVVPASAVVEAPLPGSASTLDRTEPLIDSWMSRGILGTSGGASDPCVEMSAHDHLLVLLARSCGKVTHQ
jgi:hypothetical protein